MSSLDRRARATIAFLALAGLTGSAPAAARGEEPRERYEHRSAGGQAAHRESEVRQSRTSHAAHPAPARAPANYHREMAGRTVREQRLADGSVVRETRLSGGAQVREVRGPTGGQVRVVRYGNAVSGSVERTIRPGVVSRTFVGGGHVLYTRVYQQHVWHQYGRAFAYESFVPAVRYPAVYYSWALAAWPHPVAYAWSWPIQPWYPMYGALFTPYPVYVSPDLWMTDYIIARSMQAAYQAQTGPPAPQPAPPWPPVQSPADPGAAPAPDSGAAAPAPDPSVPPSAAPGESAPMAPSGTVPPAPASVPPTVTPEVKAQLNAQIKVQLREQQAAAATPAAATIQSGPAALRPNHVFFEVVQPLDVPSGTASNYCSLSANDYIKRIGGMSQDDWKIPVVVELSGPSDCPQGLHTRIGLNDLNAMENEQEARVMEAMQAASKSMGPNGPPSSPGARPSLIADGSAAAAPMALDAIRQAQ